MNSLTEKIHAKFCSDNACKECSKPEWIPCPHCGVEYMKTMMSEHFKVCPSLRT